MLVIDEQTTMKINENLFPKIADGDATAFEALYHQSATAIYAYALTLLRNRDDAEDALQETFLKIRSAAHLYRPQGKPMAWIFTITRNICMMHFRAADRVVSMDESTELPDLGLDAISNREDRMVLESAFTVLSKDDCQIVLLHAVSGMKHREIATLLDLPIATVLSKYNRGIKKLRKELEGKL